MEKSEKKRTMVYSNVKQNKKKVEEISRIKDSKIDLDDELFIGLNKNIPVKAENKKMIQVKNKNEFSKRGNKQFQKNTKRDANRQLQKSEKNTKRKNDKQFQKENNNISRNTNKKKSSQNFKNGRLEGYREAIPKKNKSLGSNNVKKNQKNMSAPRKVSKKQRVIARLMIIIFIIAILIVGIILLLKSSLFNIKDIKVSIQDNAYLTESMILDESGITVGENIYSINKKEIINNIKQNTYVDSVKIKRSLPSTLKIEINERAPKYQISKENSFIYVDSNGNILEESSEANDTLTLTGISTDELSVGAKLNEEDMKKISDIEIIRKGFTDNNINYEISKIDISDSSDYKIYIDSQGKIIHFGDTSSMNDKITYIIEMLKDEAEVEGEIFVNVDFNNGEYAYFREKV